MTLRILVTGGLGFIGARAARAAVQRGHTVTIVDDGSGAVVDHVPGTNLLHCGVETLVADADRMPWDAIIHCAAPVGGLGVVKAGLVAGRSTSCCPSP
jgi:UDP-glucose 4-epimerase